MKKFKFCRFCENKIWNKEFLVLCILCIKDFEKLRKKEVNLKVFISKY